LTKRQVVINEFGWRIVGYLYPKYLHHITDQDCCLSLHFRPMAFHSMMKCLNLEHSVQNISFPNIYENILHLIKYCCKFHPFLMVKDKTFHNWHCHSSLIFLQSLHKVAEMIQQRQKLVCFFSSEDNAELDDDMSLPSCNFDPQPVSMCPSETEEAVTDHEDDLDDQVTI
jgi:hypothetical protein